MNFERADALNRAIRTIGLKHLGRAAELGVHPGQDVILLELAEHPRTQKQLAARATCEAAALSLMVKKLESAGLIQRRRPPLDGRVRIVELSAQGWALIPQVKVRWSALAENTVGSFDARPLDELVDLLAALADSLLVSDERHLRPGRHRRPAHELGGPSRA